MLLPRAPTHYPWSREGGEAAGLPTIRLAHDDKPLLGLLDQLTILHIYGWHSFAPFALAMAKLAVAFARASGVITRFARYGLVPILKGYKAQVLTVHSFTSIGCWQVQSKHFSRMARIGFMLCPPWLPY